MACPLGPGRGERATRCRRSRRRSGLILTRFGGHSGEVMALHRPRGWIMPRPYPPQFRRRALDLVESGRTVRDVAAALGIAESALHRWRQRDLVDRGLKPGPTSLESAELAAAHARIRARRTGQRDLRVHRRLPQPPPTPLRARLGDTPRVREHHPPADVRSSPLSPLNRVKIKVSGEAGQAPDALPPCRTS